MFIASHRTSVTSKTLIKLILMLCYKHILVIDLEYSDMAIKMHHKEKPES